MSVRACDVHLLSARPMMSSAQLTYSSIFRALTSVLVTSLGQDNTSCLHMYGHVGSPCQEEGTIVPAGITHAHVQPPNVKHTLHRLVITPPSIHTTEVKGHHEEEGEPEQQDVASLPSLAAVGVCGSGRGWGSLTS